MNNKNNKFVNFLIKSYTIYTLANYIIFNIYNFFNNLFQNCLKNRNFLKPNLMALISVYILYFILFFY